MAELPEHEARRIRDYVNTQSPPDDQAELVQKVGSQRIIGRVHEMYDVHCPGGRWWVITEPTNLYSQVDFPQIEQALIFHLGLGVFLANRSRTEMEAEQEEQVSGSWRRFTQAVEVLDDAGEAEDYQSVGIRCRDALIWLGRDHAADEWVGQLTDPPKAADFKGWANIFAERLSEGRLRQYVKALVDKTWDLTVWLQHESGATPEDAEVVLDATAHLLRVMSRLIRRREVGAPDRCPRCASYRLDEDSVVVDEPESGLETSTVCGACGWQSEVDFISWAEHFDGTEVERYLSEPAQGPSDRLGHDPRHQNPERRG